jgi:hypothetical protein
MKASGGRIQQFVPAQPRKVQMGFKSELPVAAATRPRPLCISPSCVLLHLSVEVAALKTVKNGSPKQLLKLTGFFRDKETIQPQEQ